MKSLIGSFAKLSRKIAAGDFLSTSFKLKRGILPFLKN